MIREIEQLFQTNINEELCPICYKTNMKNFKYTLFFDFTHQYCFYCVKEYCITQIENFKSEIKCIDPECNSIINNNVLKRIVSQDIYNKFRKNCRRKILDEEINPKKFPCSYPDCEEFVKFPTINDNYSEILLKCKGGHQNCKYCKDIKHYNNKFCVDPVYRFNSIQNTEVKICPICRNLLTKASDNYNNIKCANCLTSFCFLCMQEFSFDHYYIYNLFGCPGKLYYNETINKPNILYILLSIISFLLIYSIFFIFNTFFGYLYIILKWFYFEKIQKKLFNLKMTFTLVLMLLVGVILQPLFWIQYFLYVIKNTFYESLKKPRLMTVFLGYFNLKCNTRQEFMAHINQLICSECCELI